MKTTILKRITDNYGNIYLELSKIVLDNGFTEYWLTESYPSSSRVQIKISGVVDSRKEATQAFYDSYEEAIEDGLIEEKEIIIYRFQKDLNN